MKKLLSMALLAFAVVALTACGGEKLPDFKDADYRLANTAIAEDLDLHRTSLSSDFTILGNVMEGLYALGEGDVPEPALATGYTTNEEGTVYTFTLRQGAKWSNGDEITAHDFVYAWQRAVRTDLAFVPAYASMFDIVKNGEALRTGVETDVTTLGVKAVDNYTFEVTLEKPVPWFLQLTAFPALYPAHKATIEEFGEDYGSTTDALIFNGPFKVTFWDPDYGIFLEKNENYWDADAVKIESISYRLVENKQTLLTMFENDEIDRVGVTGSEYEANIDKADVIEDVVTWYLQFNLEDENFQNENLRKAVFYGIDKTELTQVMKPYVPTDSFVPRNFASTPDGVDFREYTSSVVDATKWNFNESTNGMFDKDAAQGYLNAALAELGVDTLTVNLSVFDSEGWQPLFENIHKQLNDLDGLTVNLNKKPASEVYDSYDTKEYEFGFGGWGPDYPNPLTFLEMFHSGDSHNYPQYNSAEYDALISAARDDLDILADVEAQFEKLAIAEDMMLSEAVIAPLAIRASGVLQSEKISGVVLHNFGPDVTWKYVERSE